MEALIAKKAAENGFRGPVGIEQRLPLARSTFAGRKVMRVLVLIQLSVASSSEMIGYKK
jgi:hypothetical protein